jgi:hypothetical protein
MHEQDVDYSGTLTGMVATGSFAAHPPVGSRERI